jgi:hypothetical protein
MENKPDPFASIKEWFRNQEWYLELVSKWTDLDSQLRGRILKGALGGVVGFFVIYQGTLAWKLQRLKSMVNKKEAAAVLLKAAEDRIRVVSASLPEGAEMAGGQDPQALIQRHVELVGLERSHYKLDITGPEVPSPQYLETQLQLQLKKVNLKTLMKVAAHLEVGGSGLKIRQLQIETSPDLSGFLNATLALSVLTPLAGENT